MLHIERVSDEPLDQFEIRDGETLGSVLNRLGAEGVRIDYRVERRASALTPKAAVFVAAYEREDAGSVVAFYWRYGALEAEEFDTVEEAERFIESGSEYGTLAGEAILDGNKLTVLD